MGPLVGVEKALAGVYKAAPALPKGAKEWIVKYAPWLALLGAIGTALAAWGAWHWAHVANDLADYLNTWSALYGGEKVVSTRMGAALWIMFIVLLVEAVIYLVAFSGLKAKKKSGWDMLFLGTFVNIVFGIVSLFGDYSPAGNLIGAIIGAIIAWYVLFQVRDYYTGKKVEAPKAEATEAK